jgi:hypothetical protein
MTKFTAEEAAEKCLLQLQHRAPAAKAGHIFIGVRVCLKAYPDTNREVFRKLLRRFGVTSIYGLRRFGMTIGVG